MILEDAKGFWRLVPGVRPSERSRFGFFFAISSLISLAQTLGLVGAEALFLARYGVEFLPHVFISASLVTDTVRKAAGGSKGGADFDLTAEQAGEARLQVEAGQQFRKQVEQYWKVCEQWADAQLGAPQAASQEGAKKGGSKRRSKPRSSPRSKRS